MINDSDSIIIIILIINNNKNNSTYNNFVFLNLYSVLTQMSDAV